MPSSADIRIIEVHTVDGESYVGEGDLDEHLQEADSVFYSVSWGGEEYYRWVSGPFADEDDVRAAIEDAEEYYREVA